MTSQERIAGAHERLQRRTISNRIKKIFSALDGSEIEELEENADQDLLVHTCQSIGRQRLGLIFEAISPPTFSALLKRVGLRKKIADFEDGLTRAMEIYGLSHRLIGLAFEISGVFYVYTGCPELVATNMDFLRLTLPNGERRYICSLEAVFECFNNGELI
jgi:hypothetical protein